MSLLTVKDLCVRYKNQIKKMEAVREISFSVKPGECVGIVGESGSGKSTAMQALMGLLPDTAEVSCGELKLGEQSLMVSAQNGSKKDREHFEKQMCRIRGGEMSMIFQNPSAYLNPAVKIGRQIAETIRVHKQCSTKEAKEETLRLLEMVGIRNPLQRISQYPFELSGGMQQRVAIAIALACEPKLLIADEPTTALDATVQKQILALLRRIAEETGTAMIIVTHNLSAAAVLCSRILVMKAGQIIEEGSVQDIFRYPQASYTKELVYYAQELQKGAGGQAGGGVLLKTEKVCKKYRNQNFWLGRDDQEAVHQVSMEIREGESFGIVGESGSGKTTLARLVAGIHKPTSGQILSRGEIQMVFQHSYGSFNPRFTVEQILEEPLIYQTGDNREQRMEKINKMLPLVGINPEERKKYPHQFSGGQQQRIGIARALISDPKLVVCDEPVSSLDVSIQAQILELLKEIQDRRNLSYLFISHDLNVIRHMSQRMGVMYLGRMVESGITEEVYEDPWHPYTKELLTSVLVPDPKIAKRKKRAPIKDNLFSEGKGCPYYSHCGYALECCGKEKPEIYQFDSRRVACFLYSEEHGGKRSPDYVMTAQI